GRSSGFTRRSRAGAASPATTRNSSASRWRRSDKRGSPRRPGGYRERRRHPAFIPGLLFSRPFFVGPPARPPPAAALAPPPPPPPPRGPPALPAPAPAPPPAPRADLGSLRRRCRILALVAVGALVVAGLALLDWRLQGQPHRGVVEASLFAVLVRDGQPRAAP